MVWLLQFCLYQTSWELSHKQLSGNLSCLSSLDYVWGDLLSDCLSVSWWKFISSMNDCAYWTWLFCGLHLFTVHLAENKAELIVLCWWKVDVLIGRQRVGARFMCSWFEYDCILVQYSAMEALGLHIWIKYSWKTSEVSTKLCCNEINVVEHSLATRFSLETS